MSVEEQYKNSTIRSPCGFIFSTRHRHPPAPGSNDLVTFSPLHVGSIIEDFVRLLHKSYGVKLVCVGQTLRRDNATVFNSKVGLLTRYLRVVLEPLPYAIFWGHRGLCKARSNFYAPDGVHLNRIGQYKLHKSLRGAVLRSLRLLQRPPN